MKKQSFSKSRILKYAGGLALFASIAGALGVFNPINKKEPVIGLTQKLVQEYSERTDVNDNVVEVNEPNEPAKNYPDLKPQNKKVVVLDPGHGLGNGKRYDSGAVNGLDREAKIVYNQALKVKRLLEEKGYGVHLTRGKNENPSFPERRKLASKFKAEGAEVILVSMHVNSDKDKKAWGQEVYFRKGEKSKSLAGFIQDSLLSEIGKKFETKDRGVKQEDYKILLLDVPAVLVESGFLSNIKNDKKVLTDDIPDVEYGIVNGIDAYFKAN